MGLILFILLLCLLFGGVGLFVKGLFWLFIIAAVVFAFSALFGGSRHWRN